MIFIKFGFDEYALRGDERRAAGGHECRGRVRDKTFSALYCHRKNSTRGIGVEAVERRQRSRRAPVVHFPYISAIKTID